MEKNREDKMRELTAQWNACHGAFYQVLSEDILWNLSCQNLVSYELADCAGVPVLWGKATANGVAAGLAENTFWLCLYGNIKDPRSFVSALESKAKNEGKEKVFLGADEFHFLPGAPMDTSSEPLLKELEGRGYEGRDVWDLHGDLASDPVNKFIEASAAAANEYDWRVSFAETSEDKSDLHQFLNREFPGRWKREFLFWNEFPGKKLPRWLLMREGKELLGFARVASEAWGGGDVKALRPGSLRLSFARGRQETNGALGPIGLAKAERGRGAGKALLGLSLQVLKADGVREICIDWTDLVGYYAPLEFAKVRLFKSRWRVF